MALFGTALNMSGLGIEEDNLKDLHHKALMRRPLQFKATVLFTKYKKITQVNFEYNVETETVHLLTLQVFHLFF